MTSKSTFETEKKILFLKEKIEDLSSLASDYVRYVDYDEAEKIVQFSDYARDMIKRYNIVLFVSTVDSDDYVLFSELAKATNEREFLSALEDYTERLRDLAYEAIDHVVSEAETLSDIEELCDECTITVTSVEVYSDRIEITANISDVAEKTFVYKIEKYLKDYEGVISDLYRFTIDDKRLYEYILERYAEHIDYSNNTAILRTGDGKRVRTKFEIDRTFIVHAWEVLDDEDEK